MTHRRHDAIAFEADVQVVKLGALQDVVRTWAELHRVPSASGSRHLAFAPLLKFSEIKSFCIKPSQQRFTTPRWAEERATRCA